MNVNSKILNLLKEEDLFQPRRVEQRQEDNDKKIYPEFIKIAEEQVKNGGFDFEYYQDENVNFLDGMGVIYEFQTLLGNINKEIHKVIPSKYPKLKQQALNMLRQHFTTVLNDWNLNSDFETD